MFAAKDGVKVLVIFISSCGGSVAVMAMNMCFIIDIFEKHYKAVGILAIILCFECSQWLESFHMIRIHNRLISLVL